MFAVGLTEKLSGFGTKALGASKWLFILFLFVIVGGGISYWLYRMFKFNVTCIIFSKRQGKDHIMIDKGGYFKSLMTGTYNFKLKKKKTNIQPPRFDSIGTNKILLLRQFSMDTIVPLYIEKNQLDQVNSIDKLEAYRIQRDNNIYIPIDFNVHENIDLKTAEQDIGHWTALRLREASLRYQTQSLFEKYAPYITFIVCIFIVTILIYILMKKFDVLVPAFTNAGNELAEAAKAIAASQGTGQAVPV